MSLATPERRSTASVIAPVRTIARGPNRSERLPQAMAPNAMARKPTVIALDTPVTDQPVSRAMGWSRTGKENIAPIATQPRRPPAATIPIGMEIRSCVTVPTGRYPVKSGCDRILKAVGRARRAQGSAEQIAIRCNGRYATLTSSADGTAVGLRRDGLAEGSRASSRRTRPR